MCHGFRIKLIKHNLTVKLYCIRLFLFIHIALFIIALMFRFLLLVCFDRTCVSIRPNFGGYLWDKGATLQLLRFFLLSSLLNPFLIIKSLHQDELGSLLDGSKRKVLSGFRNIGGSHCLRKIFGCRFLVKLFTLLVDLRLEELIGVLEQVNLRIRCTSFCLLLVRGRSFLARSIFRS